MSFYRRIASISGTSLIVLLFALIGPASLRAEPLPMVSFQEVTVEPGKWALAGMQVSRLDGSSYTVGDSVAGQLPEGSLAAWWDPSRLRYHVERRGETGWPEGEDARPLRPGQAFWLHVPADAAGGNHAFPVRWAGKRPDTLAHWQWVRRGLSMLAYPFPTEVRWGNTALAQACPVGTLLAAWDEAAQRYRLHARSNQGWGDGADQAIGGSRGFWLYCPEPLLWIEPRPLGQVRMPTFQSETQLRNQLGQPTYYGWPRIVPGPVGQPIGIPISFPVNGPIAVPGGAGPPVQMVVDSSVQFSALAEGDATARDFSGTNNQVEGVDEADIVKTDGRFIYSASGNRLFITDAYPVEAADIAARIDLGNMRPLEMLIYEDELLLFGSDEHYRFVAHWYDVSDRAAPHLRRSIRVRGSYITSRLIGSRVYLVVRSSINTYDPDLPLIPAYLEDGRAEPLAAPGDIARVPHVNARELLTVASLDLEDGETHRFTMATGGGVTVYASRRNLYLAHTTGYETLITKLHLQDGRVGFVEDARVEGTLLNQFSMDEFRHNLRVATTVGWMGHSKVSILGPNLEEWGSVDGLAPTERIYAARFVGPRLYLVTFKKVDPLFVINLEDPRRPFVEGELKIPGYSDYLHPFDEHHLIGLGKDTIEAVQGDFAWYQGLRMAIFNVADVTNPRELHTLIVGDRGTDSRALHNHKAFLFDRDRELLVIPIALSEIEGDRENPLRPDGSPRYGERVFQGAFVFRVTLADGFQERARITHTTSDNLYGNQVERSLYIDDVLYTLSPGFLKGHALGSLDELLTLPFE